MKKTLLITLDFWPNRGGVANYYYNLCKNLPAEDIFVLTNAEKKPNSLKIFNQKLLYKFFWPQWIKAYIETLKLIKKYSIQKIWVGNLLPLGTVAYLIYKRYKIPYFVSLHGLDILNALKNKRKKILAQKILTNAEFITVNSECTKNLLKNFKLDQEKIKLIYPGINLNFQNIEQEKLLKIQNKYNLKNKKVILTTGRLVKRKNHKLVIKTIKELVKKFPDLIYLIIGDGPELKNYKLQITSYKLQNHIKILTDINNQELPYFYKLSDIFVMVSKISPNDIEGFGIVYLEAGLFQTPVIAGHSGGVKEAVIDKQTGLLVDNNLEELKAALEKLLTEPDLRQKLGQNAEQRIKNKFLWSDISQKLINYIERSESANTSC